MEMYKPKRAVINNVTPDFKDKRGRTWECFIDQGYWEMTCVRWKEDKSFDSHTSFHFNTSKEALEFCELLKRSS